MTTNLRNLVWVRDEQTAEGHNSVVTAYALDGVYVYRRVTRPLDGVPRPRYFRTSHRDVLRTAGSWSEVEESIWESVNETGKPMNVIAKPGD